MQYFYLITTINNAEQELHIHNNVAYFKLRLACICVKCGF